MKVLFLFLAGSPLNCARILLLVFASVSTLCLLDRRESGVGTCFYRTTVAYDRYNKIKRLTQKN